MVAGAVLGNVIWVLFLILLSVMAFSTWVKIPKDHELRDRLSNMPLFGKLFQHRWVILLFGLICLTGAIWESIMLF